MWCEGIAPGLAHQPLGFPSMATKFNFEGDQMATRGRAYHKGESAKPTCTLGIRQMRRGGGGGGADI